MMMKDNCTLPECNETTFSAMNDFYRRLRTLEVPFPAFSHSKQSCTESHPGEGSRRESLVERASAAEEQSRLEAALAEKEKEVEKLKFEMIEMASKLEKERSDRREAVVQATDRLQQLVAMQTQIGLERQAMSEDLNRLREYESQQVEMGRRAKAMEKEKKKLEARVKEEETLRVTVQEQLEGKKSEVLVQKDLNEALTAALQKKTVDVENMAREVQSVRAESGARARELAALGQTNKEMERKMERLQANITQLKATENALRVESSQLHAEAEEGKQRECVLRKEIAGFVRIIGWRDE